MGVGFCCERDNKNKGNHINNKREDESHKSSKSGHPKLADLLNLVLVRTVYSSMEMERPAVSHQLIMLELIKLMMY